MITNTREQNAAFLAKIDARRAARAADEAAPVNTTARRVLVAAGQYQIGDQINGREILGLGRPWYTDGTDNSAHGIGPDVDRVQYAYFTAR